MCPAFAVVGPEGNGKQDSGLRFHAFLGLTGYWVADSKQTQLKAYIQIMTNIVEIK